MTEKSYVTGRDLINELDARLKELGQPESAYFELMDQVDSASDADPSPIFKIIVGISAACEENGLDDDAFDEEANNRYTEEYLEAMRNIDGVSAEKRAKLDAILRSLTQKPLEQASEELLQQLIGQGLHRPLMNQLEQHTLMERLPVQIVQQFREQIRALDASKL